MEVRKADQRIDADQIATGEVVQCFGFIVADAPTIAWSAESLSGGMAVDAHRHEKVGGDIGAGASIPAIADVPLDRPWDWLARGWRDLTTAPMISLAYGCAAALAFLAMSLGLVSTGLESLIPVLAGGFLLIGPLLAAGLYEKSRALAAGEMPTLASTVRAGLGAAGRMGLMAALLLVIYILWVRIAFLLMALFLGTRALPPAREFMTQLLFTSHGLGLLVVGTAVGAVLATVVFAISVVSIPMLMDRRIDAFSAIAASFGAVARNPAPMALWAALIAGFVALGLLTLGFGLIVALPLIGHATWHAYRDVIVDS